MFLKVKILGHEIGNNTINSIPSKIEAIKRIPSPEEKKDVMQFLGSVNFSSKFIEHYTKTLNHNIPYYKMMLNFNGNLNSKNYFNTLKTK